MSSSLSTPSLDLSYPCRRILKIGPLRLVSNSLRYSRDVSKFSLEAIVSVETTMPAVCSHGVEYSEADCAISATHATNRGLTPDQVIADYMKHHIAVGRRCRDIIPCTLNVAYGRASRAKIDWYGLDGLPGSAPIYVFIHGGLWTEGSKDNMCSFVEQATSHGCIAAILGYTLAPEKSMTQILAEVCEALTSIEQLASQRGCRGVHLCGHSAGAHLAAMAFLLVDISVIGRIRSLLLLSGIYHLQDVLNTAVGQKLKLSVDDVRDCSPMEHTDAFVSRCRHVQIVLAVGEHEMPFYRSQYDQLHEMLTRNQHNLKKQLISLVVKDCDHFTLLHKLCKSNFELTNIFLNVIKS